MRELIVNADDLGLSEGVNRGIAEAHVRGVVTSASLMVRGVQAPAAAALALTHPRLGVGLHVDLGEWRYAGGTWHAAYEVVASDDPAAVDAEVAAQLERFERLLGRQPTHIDGHQHVQRDEPVRASVLRHAERLGVVVRDCTPAVRYEGGFYGQAGRGEPWLEGISVASLCALVRALPFGVTELGCHPALDDRSGSSYSDERTVETATLCDARVRDALADAGVVLRSFAGIAPLRFDRVG